MSVSEYLHKRYIGYVNGVPVDCLEYETLASQKELHKIKRYAAKLLNRERLGGTIPLKIFIDLVDLYLQEITIK